VFVVYVYFVNDLVRELLDTDSHGKKCSQNTGFKPKIRCHLGAVGVDEETVTKLISDYEHAR